MEQTTMTRRIQELYDAFNRRDLQLTLDRMADHVKWPRAFKGGYVRGPEAVRAYWQEQWQEIDAKVEPMSIEQRDDGSFDVEVHQIVRDRAGTVISDSVVHHVYRFDGDLILSMDLGGPATS